MGGSKNQVTLDFAGDTTKLTKAFDQVGAEAGKMSTKVGEASSKMSSFSETTDKVASKTGTATGALGAMNSGVDLLNAKSEARKQKLANENEQISAQIAKLSEQKDATGKMSAATQAQINALNGQAAANNQSTAAIDKSEAKTQAWTNGLMGASYAFDAVSGASDLLTLATESGIAKKIASTAATVGNTVASVANSVAQKAAAVASNVWAGAQWLLNAALDANPIGLIVVGIGALIAVIVLIATKTTWFQTAWKAAWGFIKTAAVDVWDWLKALPGNIGSAFAKVGGFITAPFRAAFNFVSDAWNNTIGSFSFTVPSWIPGIGGDSFSMPKLPKFHTGGVVPGLPGSEMLGILQAGERISPIGAPSSGGGSVVYVDLGPAIMAIIRQHISTRFGGDVTIALAGSR